MPFYNIWNRFVNFIELFNFQNYFLDFDKNEFEKKQAKMIFDEIGSLLEKKDYTTASKHLNEHLLNVYYTFLIKDLFIYCTIKNMILN